MPSMHEGKQYCPAASSSEQGEQSDVQCVRVRLSEFRHPPLHLGNNGAIGFKSGASWLYVGDLHHTTGWRRVRDSEGYGVMTYGVMVSGKVASYVHPDQVGSTTPTMAQRYVALSRGMKGTDILDTDMDDVIGFRDVDKMDFTSSGEAYEGLNEILEHVPIASGFHLHVTPEEAYEIAKKVGRTGMAERTADVIARVEGATQASLATWMLWSATAKEEVVSPLLNVLNHLDIKSLSRMSKILKAITVRAKQMQHSLAVDLTHIFETEVLVNRGVGKVDWDGEMENRTNARIVEMEPGIVRKAAMSIFEAGKARGYRYQERNFSDWWETRWLHVPNGSAHARADALSRQRELIRKTEGFSKKMLLSSVNSLCLEDILGSSPGIDAWPSVKYEWGKQRAIYGTDIEGFILADLAYPDCEKAVPSSIVIGEDASEDKVRRTVSQMSEGTMPFCFDYEDFNSQHSSDSMREVLEAYRLVYASGMSKDQYRAAVWTEQSLGNMNVHANENIGARGYKAKHTLLSGWRLTTLVNSVLNRIYLESAGSLDEALHTIHSGDDVYAACLTVGDADKFLTKAKEFGIRAQPSKAATGSIAEFLRIDHRGEHTNSQYLSRSCSTVVHSRIESRRVESVQAMITASESRISDMAVRGAGSDLIAELRALTDKRTMSAFKVGPEVCEAFRSLHPLEGGSTVTSEPSGSKLINVPITHSSEGKIAQVSEEIRRAYTPGANDVARWITDKIGNRERRDEISEEIFNATIECNLLVRRKVELTDYPVTGNTLRDFANYRCWKKVAGAGLGQVIKGLSLSLVKIAAAVFHPTIAERLRVSDDPLHTAVVCL